MRRCCFCWCCCCCCGCWIRGSSGMQWYEFPLRKLRLAIHRFYIFRLTVCRTYAACVCLRLLLQLHHWKPKQKDEKLRQYGYFLAGLLTERQLSACVICPSVHPSNHPSTHSSAYPHVLVRTSFRPVHPSTDHPLIIPCEHPSTQCFLQPSIRRAPPKHPPTSRPTRPPTRPLVHS